jgi:hypothetical protein
MVELTPPPADRQPGLPANPPSPFLQTIDRVLYPITLGYTAVIFAFQIYELRDVSAEV